MSHDTDKLIRQLSLVAFLMAERRPLTARDVKGNVEGYSEMSDEAFARRFYSDRAELIALGVPLHSQRDEFTGEELYTLRSENYFLDELELDDDELAALQTALYMLEGTFAYAEPLRLALQNLALGRPGFDDAPTETAASVQVRDPDYSPEMAGRLSKLESAISKQRTIKFSYWSPRRDQTRERTLNPYALRRDRGTWYVVGHDLDNDDVRTFRVSRVRSDIRFATRRERDFRLPADFDVDAYRVGEDWQHGPVAGTAKIEVNGDTAWWVHRTLHEAGTLADGVFETEYAAIEPLAGWVLRQNGRALPLEPEELRAACAEGLRRVREAHEAEPPKLAREKTVEISPDGLERPAPAVAPERFGVLQALLAYLLAACGEAATRELDADDLAARFHIPREELQDHLSLLNLVNFGGGCYTVYAELDGDTVRVDKELYGDVFRLAPRLTPLEARAIRLALDIVGPSIAAQVHTPLDRVRKKLEETFGQFEDHQTPETRSELDEEELVATLSRGIAERRVVAIEYLKEGDETPTERLVEPYTFERVLPNWIIHTWDRSVGRRALLPARPDAFGAVTDERFEPRDGFDPHFLEDALQVRVRYAQAGRPLPRRARRDEADGRLGARDAARRHPRLADQRDPGRPRRGGRARAGGRPARDREARRPAAARAQADARQAPGLTDRQTQREDGALAGRRLDVERAAVRLGERAREEEPEARPRLRRPGHAAELLEDLDLVLGADPGSRVADVDDHVAVVGTGLDADLAAGVRVLDRVRDQVVDELTEPLRVAAHARQRGRQLGREPHFVLADLGGGDRVAQHLGQIDVAEAVAEGAGLDPRRVEHVADERREPRRLVRDHGEERLALLGPELAPACLQRPGRADHGRHRAAQLVRDERDEVGAERRQAPQLVHRRALGLVRAQVLHRRRDEPPEERHQAELLLPERPGLPP